MKSKKQQRKEYKLKKLRAGVFQIILREENKIFPQTTEDLERAFNSDKFKLNAGMHSNKELQSDWDKLGEEAFDFEILDELESDDTATSEQITSDLKELLEIHKNEMKLKGQALY